MAKETTNKADKPKNEKILWMASPYTAVSAWLQWRTLI